MGLPLSAQSFDCAKAAKAAEKLVCSDDGLKKLDLQLSQVYKQAVAKLGTQEEKYQLQQNEQLWLKERFNECRSASCLSTAYQERIAELAGSGAGTYRIQPLHLSSSLTLPQLTGTPETPAVRKFNDLVRSAIDRKAKLDGDYEASVVRDRYVNAYLRLANDTGGAHPNPERYSVLFDLNRGETVPLSGLFRPGAEYLPLLSQLARPILAERVRKQQANGDAEWITTGIAPTPDNFKRFTITDNALVIHLAPYQVGPYSDGDSIVTIPASALQTVLDPSGPLGKTPSAASR